MRHGAVGVLFFAAAVACFSEDVEPQVVIQRETLPQPPADKQIAWLVHRGGWGDSPAYGTRIDSNHLDELVNDFSTGLDAEYNVLKELTNASFIQDFGNVREFASAATANGMDYAIMNTVSPLALSGYGVETAEDCAAFFIKQLSVLKEFPNHTRMDGKVVVFVFNVSAFNWDQWKTVLQETRKAYPSEEFLFIGHRSVVHVLGQRDPQVYMTGLLDAFDGIMFWSALTDKKLQNLELARNAMQILGREKLIFWTTSSGYWRPEKGMFVAPQNTKVWRDQLELCFSNNFDGMMIESWNDLEEHTQVAPTRDAGGVMFELLKYYSAISNQKEYCTEGPGLLLTHPREILFGETLRVEIISLPVKEVRKTFRLELDDEQGNLVYQSPEQPVPPESADVFTFSVPTRDLPDCGNLDYRIVTDGRAIRAGSRTDIKKSGVENPWVRGVVLSELIPADHVDFSFQPLETGHQASVNIQHDVPLSRVDIYRGDNPVWSLDAERLNRQQEWQRAPVGLQLDFRMPCVSEETKNRCGVLTVSDGQLIRGYDKIGRSLVTALDRAEWDDPPSLGRQFNVKLLADADDSTAFHIDLPVLNQTIEFTLADLRKNKRLEVKTAPHGRVWIQEIAHPVVWQYEAGELGTNVNESVVVSSVGEKFKNEYYLRVVDQDGKIFRSDPVTLYSETRTGLTDQWFWDEKAAARFAAPVDAKERQELVWSFDMPDIRVYDDEQNNGVHALLGGGMYRVGHFEPHAIPGSVERGGGHALSFDGNDYVQMDAGSFPQGAFELSLDVFPEAEAAEPQMLFFTRLNLSLFIRADGRVAAQMKGLTGMDPDKIAAELVSRNALPNHQWDNVKVRYDYNELSLTVNNETVSVPLSGGPDRDMSAESYLGAEVEGTQATTARRFFIGKLDNLKIQCGAE